MYDELKDRALRSNLRIVEAGLVLLTWGNASAADRQNGVFAIKPSGVPYAELGADDMVIVDIETETVVEGTLKPSSDTPTHAELYRAFADVAGIVHTHSHYAVCYAQSRVPIPSLGTTHADHFRGPIPVTRELTKREVAVEYEKNTGRVLVEHFRSAGIRELDTPGALVAHHGPFAWGRTAENAVENAIVLEEVARMAFHSAALGHLVEAPLYLTEKHFARKHGAGAYYGQTVPVTPDPDESRYPSSG